VALIHRNLHLRSARWFLKSTYHSQWEELL
jgi:hypothetical protein